MHPILSETRISLSEARQQLPGRNGKPPHASTLFRWITRGISLTNGERVRLDAVRVGNAWYTSTEAVHRFVEALSALPQATPPSRPPATRRKASARAAKRLEALGI